jgi:hypothetical protein
LCFESIEHGENVSRVFLNCWRGITFATVVIGNIGNLLLKQAAMFGCFIQRRFCFGHKSAFLSQHLAVGSSLLTKHARQIVSLQLTAPVFDKSEPALQSTVIHEMNGWQKRRIY